MNARQSVADCDLCVQACPTRALRAGPTGLTLEPAACSGCAACGASCPVGAIQIAGAVPLPPGLPSGAGEMLLTCPRQAPAAEGTLCLQALGLEALAALWLRGLRKLWLGIADCATCPNGRGLEFTARLAVVNALLADRGLPQIEAAPAPRRLPPQVPRLGDDRADPARRGFLRLAATPLTESPASGPKALARLQSLAPRPEAPRCAFVPVLEAARCSACHACTRLCPEGALTLINAETAEAAYEVDATRCTGCGICVAACQEDAIRIETMVPPTAQRLALYPGQCRGCGVAFLVPGAPPAPGALCPVCARAPHFRKLHQVLS